MKKKSSKAENAGMAGVNLKTSGAPASEMCHGVPASAMERVMKKKKLLSCSTRASSRTQDWNISFGMQMIKYSIFRAFKAFYF